MLNNSLVRITTIFALSIRICPQADVFAQAPASRAPESGTSPAKITPQTESNNSALGSKNVPPLQKHSGAFGSHLKPLLLHLKTTTDQTNKITGIMDSYRDKIEPLRLRYRLVSKAFLDAMIKGSSSQEIMEHQMELARLNSDISNQYCLMSLEIRRCLSDKQVVQYEEYRQQQGWGKRQ